MGSFRSPLSPSQPAYDSARTKSYWRSVLNPDSAE
jgi:hypothetical protein